MSNLLTMHASRSVLFQTAQAEQAETIQNDNHENFTFPNRGIVLATLISAILWAALFLAAREIWLLLR